MVKQIAFESLSTSRGTVATRISTSNSMKTALPTSPITSAPRTLASQLTQPSYPSTANTAKPTPASLIRTPS